MKLRKRKKQEKRANKIIVYIILFISALITAISIYIKTNFQVGSFEQLLYTLFNAQGSSYSSLTKGIIITLIGVFALFLIYSSPILLRNSKYKAYMNIKIKKKKKEYILPISYVTKKGWYAAIIFIISIILSCYLLGIFPFIKYQFTTSKIYEDYYVDAKNVKLKFPEKKKNLIYIYLESMETTYMDNENGGDQDSSYIPNLEKIALENTNFSNNDKLGGALQLYGTSWTVAGMVAQTSGVNLKLDIDGNDYHEYSAFLPGVTSLGDILNKNGYKNYLMIGSDINFAGRSDYFTQHGKYDIFDYNTAKNTKKIDKDYYEWWGFEDKKLFEFAQEKLTKISKKDEPFDFTLLTADTHFVDGYLDESCEEIFDEAYANSIYCSDGMVYNFINWIKEQDFYENTTIILSGDHLTMQDNFYKEDGYQRVVYNSILNSSANTDNYKKRKFSTMDMFPTTLASLGVEIEGNRLGLGTNLYSNKKTLIEEFGFDYINEELSKKSMFYNNNLLGSSYYEMQDKENNNQ